MVGGKMLLTVVDYCYISLFITVNYTLYAWLTGIFDVQRKYGNNERKIKSDRIHCARCKCTSRRRRRRRRLHRLQ